AVTSGENRATTSPWRLTRNFSKFHSTSFGSAGWIPKPLRRSRKGPLRLGGGQFCIQWMLVVTQDRDLRVQRKLHVVLGRAETLDLLVTARLLTLEVVGGKAQHFQALVPLAFVQGFQSGVLGCQPAFGGDVDDQEHLAAVVGQTVRGAINACQRDLL